MRSDDPYRTPAEEFEGERITTEWEQIERSRATNTSFAVGMLTGALSQLFLCWVVLALYYRVMRSIRVFFDDRVCEEISLSVFGSFVILFTVCSVYFSTKEEKER